MGTILLWAIAIALIVQAKRKACHAIWPVFRQGLTSFIAILPRFVMAVVTAGFLGKLLPGDLIVSLIGGESGLGGVFLASLLGGFVPGGPLISFPIVVLLRDMGAGLPQLIAFLTAWSVLALHRVLMYESALMGWRFSVTRLASSLILAPIAGVAALLIV
ncbi:hypothetical protein [Ancylobacter polymorphus]|uniref:Uncharacterized membrane protein YraQ (UPF0718 family) n=1 Tax=Ancylobacter polymorphus TaxID=223390 RepID=A0ABU0BGI4_9HYPH|nr:hypothetical protein [Ancylobacter polymorphus]MDQ0304948.1 uncharacterized membrane protein YraQ (UPF0718 family) [Ancylobacter polymorphus]